MGYEFLKFTYYEVQNEMFKREDENVNNNQ